MKVGDKIVVIKGSDKRGKTGRVVSISGKCAGEPAVFCAIEMARHTAVTFFPQSYLAVIK